MNNEHSGWIGSNALQLTGLLVKGSLGANQPITVEGGPGASYRALFSALSFSTFLLEDAGMKVANFHLLQSQSSERE